jgi:hypothetical protein
MVNAFTENTFSATYKDDWKDSDHYHRILFNSGRALQARELTQMQTIIQEEIAKFGRNIFKDGASVNPGGPTVRNNVEYVKLNTTTGETPTDAILGTEFTGQTSAIKARVIRVVAAEGSDPATIYVQYTDTSAGTSGSEPIRFTAGETLNNGSVNLVVQTAAPHVGQGTLFSNAGGDFFARGHFVFAEPQTIVLSKYTTTPNAEIGFRIVEDIITASDNDALFDNQGATPNRASPGADRYRIRLILINKANLAAGENFVYYANVVAGEIVEQVSAISSYNAPAELLAQNTRETNGDYIVKEFRLDFTADSDATKIIANIAPGGVAYVDGFRADAEQGATIRIDKPRTSVLVENDIIGIYYGNYVSVDELQGNVVSSFAKQNLSTSTTDPSGSVIGTARVRYVEEDGANYKVYLFDIEMNSGQSFRNARTIGTNANNFVKIALEGGQAVIKDATSKSLVYPLTHIRPAEIDDVTFETQRVITAGASTVSADNFSLSISGDEKFSNTSDWFITSLDSGGVVSGATFTLTGNGTGVDITNLPTLTANYAVYAKVTKTNAAGMARQKTLTELTYSGSIESDGSGIRFLDLHRTDLHDVISIKETDSDGRDVSADFTIDNGRRPGFYDNARYILSANASAPSTVFTRFKHFRHGVGDYFDKTSYDGQIAYEDIPSNLRNVIDFRSSVDSNGNFTGTRAALNEVPTSGDVFQADVSYYQGRTDRIIASRDGTIKHQQGQAGFDRQAPSLAAGTLPLFTIDFPPYVLNDSDVGVVPLKHKRFQMKDIARLEERINDLVEDVALNALEADTSTLLIQDASGNIRTKSGFFADNFGDRGFSDTQAADYRAAIDPSTQTLSASVHRYGINLVYDSDASTNTIMKGDIVYIKHSHAIAVQQNRISGVENVNPFAVISGEGNLTISPSSDTWVDEKYEPNKVIGGGDVLKDTGIVENEGEVEGRGTELANQRAGKRLDWINHSASYTNWLTGEPFTYFWRSVGEWNWNGTNNEGRVTDEGSYTSTRRKKKKRSAFGGHYMKTYTKKGRQFSQKIITDSYAKLEEVGDRQVSLTFLPFVRSRKMFFKAQGLRPNTQYFAFFDGKSVADYVRTESTFERMGAKAGTAYTEEGEYSKTFSHPSGATTLTSDEDGELIGSFFIPSNSRLRFKAGTKEFKLLDINVNQNDASTSRAVALYYSQGELDTRQKTFKNTRMLEFKTRRWQEVCWSDPLAQSFRTSTGNGIFVTKIDAFLNKNGEDTIPIQMQIRPMENGSPSSSTILPGATVFVKAGDVVDNASSTTQAQVIANPTTFEFEEPVFLEPNTEYAIVLLADTTNYEAYVAETYQFELGSTESRINRQPSMGSLFKSQNGTTWTPDQTKDLAFTVYKAQFDTAGGTARYENRPIQPEPTRPNPFYGDSGDRMLTMMFPAHGFSAAAGDQVTITGLDSATRYNGILGSSIMGPRNVDSADNFVIRFEADSAPTSTGLFGGTSVISTRQFNYDDLYPIIDYLAPEDTTVDFEVQTLTGSSFAGTETRYQALGFTNDVENKESNIFDFPRILALSSNETAAKSVEFNINMNTIDPDVSPFIDGQRTAVIAEANIIDKQASSPGSGYNVPYSYVAETDARFGTAAAKHITSIIEVPETAVGIKVILDAVRPNESTLTLYYRTATGDEEIRDKVWTLQTSEISVPPSETFAQYRYLIGGTEGTLTPFTKYQLKLVMESTNSSRVPIVKDLRGIALAT